MVSALEKFSSWLPAINPSQGVNGGQSTQRTQSLTPQPADNYGKLDRSMEHGFGGAQYRDGVLIGEKFNMEF